MEETPQSCRLQGSTFWTSKRFGIPLNKRHAAVPLVTSCQSSSIANLQQVTDVEETNVVKPCKAAMNLPSIAAKSLRIIWALQTGPPSPQVNQWKRHQLLAFHPNSSKRRSLQWWQHVATLHVKVRLDDHRHP